MKKGGGVGGVTVGNRGGYDGVVAEMPMKSVRSVRKLSRRAYAR